MLNISNACDRKIAVIYAGNDLNALRWPKDETNPLDPVDHGKKIAADMLWMKDYWLNVFFMKGVHVMLIKVVRFISFYFFVFKSLLQDFVLISHIFRIFRIASSSFRCNFIAMSLFIKPNTIS